MPLGTEDGYTPIQPEDLSTHRPPLASGSAKYAHHHKAPMKTTEQHTRQLGAHLSLTESQQPRRDQADS